MQEVFEKISNRIKDYFKSIIEIKDGWDVVEINAYIQEIIKQVAEKYKVGWISCSERLPEEETTVIVSTKTDCVRVGMYTKRYGFEQREGFMCDDGFMHMNTVIAWKPLPEPYKGD